MNCQLLVPLLITTVVATVGWFIAHALAARRDRTRRQIDLRVEYLIEAYRRLEGCSNRGQGALDESDLESALADIQLLGSLKQIELAMEFSRAFSANEGNDLDDLLAALRAELRAELQIPVAPNNITYLRVLRENKPGAAR